MESVQSIDTSQMRQPPPLKNSVNRMSLLKQFIDILHSLSSTQLLHALFDSIGKSVNWQLSKGNKKGPLSCRGPCCFEGCKALTIRSEAGRYALGRICIITKIKQFVKSFFRCTQVPNTL